MADQAALDMAPPDLGGAARRAWVVDHLRRTTETNQAGIRAELDDLVAAGHVTSYQSFWVLNGVAVTADGEALLALAARTDVARIREDRWLQRIADSGTNRAKPASGVETSVARPDEETEWNLAQIRAPEVWTALGITGTGVVVGLIDTGADWQHPLIQSRYRGYNPHGPPIHEGNWICTTDEGYLYPGDGNGHGTHVTGIAVGGLDDAGVAVGVAPGARWIAAKAFTNSGYSYDSWLHAAFEWMLAPAGNPALAPDIVSNSWGTVNGDDETFRPDLTALRAAGIVPVFAAGNGGPDPATVESPASLQETLAVGASDDKDLVASFSSRGPSPWGEIKPEVVAPGVNIRSSLPGGGYGLLSGTSMAAPHVAGAIALLLEAAPGQSVQQIEDLLTTTALPIGAPVPNNDAGWGRIDAYEAVATALGAGYLAGSVTTNPGGAPVASAHVSVTDHSGAPRGQANTGPDGRYQVTLPSGLYDVTASAFGYESSTAYGIPISVGMTTTLSLSLAQVPSGVVWGVVSNAQTGAPVEASIAALGTPAATTSNPQDGSYRLVLPVGEYTLRVWQNGFRVFQAESVPVVADGSTQMDAALEPAPRLLLVDSGAWYYGSEISYLQRALDDRAFAYDNWEIRTLPQDLPALDDLTPFDVVVWSAPWDAPGFIGAGDVISTYLTMGGNLLLTGQDIGLWDGGLTGAFWAPYYTELLQARALADDAGDGPIAGIEGDLLGGLTLPLNGPDSAQNQEFPDEIALADPQVGAILGQYSGDGGAALRVGTCLPFRAAYLAAGLEGLGDRASRAETMERLVTWLASPPELHGADASPGEQSQVWLGQQPMTYTWTLRNTGAAADQFRLWLSPSAWPTTVWDERFAAPLPPTVTLESCEAIAVGIQVQVPPGAGWNVSDAVTLTAQSLSDPSILARTTLYSKTPAPILLVDDHRWHDVLGAYKQALDANHLTYDIWLNNWSPLPNTDSPSLERLQRYPVVIWFTGYDWYATLTPLNESSLRAYLDSGGRLLLSSQDYLYTSGLTAFGRDYLGIGGSTEALTATVVSGAVGSAVGSGLGPYDLVYPFPNWSDALRPTSSAPAAFWGQHGQPVALTLQQAGWKTAFFAIPLEALPVEGMKTVLGHAVRWLSPLGDSSIRVDRPVAGAGEQLDYTLLIQNTGPTPLSHVSLSNTVPLSTSYISGSLVGPAEYDPGTHRFVWKGALDSGQTVMVAYSLRLDLGLPDGVSIENVAALDDDRGLAAVRAVTSRIRTPDLSSSIQLASSATARPSEALTFTLVLWNRGLSPSQATLTDAMPPYASHSPGTAWASSGVVTSTAQALTWTGTITLGQKVTITVPVTAGNLSTGRYLLNRASLDDGWGKSLALEAYIWIESRVYLPWLSRRSRIP